MKGKLFSILKYAACCAVFLSVYPVIVLYNAILTPVYSGTACLFQLLLCVAFGFTGYGLSALLSRGKRIPVWLAKLIRLAGVTIPVGFSFVLLQGDTEVFVCSMLVFALSYFVGSIFYFKSYRDIFSHSLYIAVIAINLIVLFILWHFQYPYYPSGFVIVFLLFTVVYGITNNQAHLDFLMERRKHNLKHLPAKIRYYNLGFLSVLFFAVLLCYLARNAIIKAIFMLGEFLKYAVQKVFWLIQFLLSLLHRDSEPIEEASPQSTPAALPGDNSAGASMWWLYVLIAAMVIACIYYYRKQILESFRTIWHKIRDFILQLLHKAPVISSLHDASEYYYDHEEIISADERKKTSKAVYSPSMKQWKRKYKKFDQMTGTKEKFRFGYALVVEWLLMNGVGIKKSDTTIEILQKADACLASSNYAAVTKEYNSIRYGETDLDSQNMKSLYRTLAEIVKK